MQKRACSDLKTTLKAVYDELTAFLFLHAGLFSDKDATKSYSGAFQERHGVLRAQIAQILAPACLISPAKDKHFLAEFIAESLLVWTIAKKEFEEIYQIVQLLIQKQ